MVNHMLAPGPAGVKIRFMGEFMLLLDRISVRDEDNILQCTAPGDLTAAGILCGTKVQSKSERKGSPL